MPTTKLYYFTELSEDAKQKAIDDARYSQVEFDDWHEPIFDEWKDKLADLGFIFETKEQDIHYSGFGSQGDGACFEATVDLHAFIKAHGLANTYRSLYYWTDPERTDAGAYCYAHITLDGRSHYYHEYTMGEEHDWDSLTDGYGNELPDPPAAKQLDEIMPFVLEKARQYAKQIYRELEKAYFDETSDESIRDWLEDDVTANDAPNLYLASGEHAGYKQTAHTWPKYSIEVITEDPPEAGYWHVYQNTHKVDGTIVTEHAAYANYDLAAEQFLALTRMAVANDFQDGWDADEAEQLLKARRFFAHGTGSNGSRADTVTVFLVPEP